MDITLNGAKILATFETPLGTMHLTQTLVVAWVVMALISILCIWLGSNLSVTNIGRKQAVAEMVYEALVNFVRGNMGIHFDYYIPLVGTIFITSIISNLISLVGFWSPTADLMTEIGWALVVFVLITYHKIKSSGILGYLKGFLDPVFLMAPINVISECFTPVSMACRHFGNILSGTVISTLIYAALAIASKALFQAIGSVMVVNIAVLAVAVLLIWLGDSKKSKVKEGFGWVLFVIGMLSGICRIFPVAAAFPWLDVGLPAITSFYFDWFSGCIQAFIFCTLTTIFIKQAAGEDS